jgi:hypothetical protein
LRICVSSKNLAADRSECTAVAQSDTQQLICAIDYDSAMQRLNQQYYIGAQSSGGVDWRTRAELQRQQDQIRQLQSDQYFNSIPRPIWAPSY